MKAVKMFRSHSAAETEAIAAALARLLQPGDVVALYGGLGVGKTAFVRGLAAGLGITAWVSSPSFTLVHEYEGEPPLVHFDMDRISGWDDLVTTGFFDYLDAGAVLAVEWSEHIESALPPNAIRVRLIPDGDEERTIEIEGGDALAHLGD